MEKKIKTEAFDFSVKEIIIYSILCILLAISIPIMNITRNKKAEAYTNNVVTYANITNLTNTTWVFNNVYLDFSSVNNDVTYNLNFTSNNTNYTKLTLLVDENIVMFNDDYISDSIAGFNEDYKTINITGGTDATNTNLIAFLQENATIQQNEEFYNISYNLQNVLIVGTKPTQISNLEEIEIEIQNFNNYELPQNIMIENASYNWNYETGILTIYDATGNISITIRAEYISGNYSFIELIDSVVLIPLNTFFNLFNFELFGVNIYALLTATLTLFVIIKILLKVFK